MSASAEVRVQWRCPSSPADSQQYRRNQEVRHCSERHAQAKNSRAERAENGETPATTAAQYRTITLQYSAALRRDTCAVELTKQCPAR